MWSKIRMDQIFPKQQTFWQNRWRADGIRVKYLPKSQWMRCSSVVKSKIYTTFLVEQKTMKKNVWQTLDSYLDMQEDLVLDNGHLFVLVPNRSGILWKRTIHKEFRTKLQKGWCWNSLRADVQFSLLQLHCPVNSKTKDMVNCRYTMRPQRKRLKLFFAYLFLQTSSAFTEQLQTCVKNLNPFKIDHGNLMHWWGNQSCSVHQDRSFFEKWWPSISKISISTTWKTNWEALTTR